MAAMASTQSTSSASTPSFSNSNSCGDSVDIDAFINYDQPHYPSPSLSPSNTRGKAPAFQRPSVSSSSSTYATQQSQAQTFSGPSHQYEQYKQQTGLPVGGLANTFAFNDINYAMNSGLPMSNDPLFDLGVSDGMYGFNTMDGRNLSVGDGSELDLDMDSPNNEALPAFFYPSTKSEFIDPTALEGQEEPSPPTNTVGRVWPGMHQQAAMAKAAQQQKQQELMRQQQRQRQMTTQQAAPSATRNNRAAAHHPNDPLVEERISRLLQQMRQSSAGADDDAATPTNSLPHMIKAKKDEEDMDEDERLLASEEGKKLSSKERRQLRNKVSARAFRSRRKEYIGQLEGEVAKQSQENSELKTQNRALMEENARLTELTRMLLSSSAFAGFMNELSIDQASHPPAQDQQSIQQQTTVQPNTHKDINPNQIVPQAHQQQQQISLARMPEIDFSNLDINGSWASGMDMTINNTQVFAVTEVPQGPAVDTEILSGKASNFVPSTSATEKTKDEVPMVERVPAAEPVEESATVSQDESVDFDESDPAFVLFADATPPKDDTPTDVGDLFGGISPEKVFSRVELVTEDECAASETLAMERLEYMFSSMEESYQRIESLMYHLR